jgi:hypothetical protein
MPQNNRPENADSFFAYEPPTIPLGVDVTDEGA